MHLTVRSGARKPLVPFDDESLLGYLARFAADNLIDRMIELTGSIGGDHANRQILATRTPEEIATLAPVLGIDEASIMKRTYAPVDRGGSDHDFFGTVVHRHDLELRIRRFSPTSLQASAHDRALWQLRPFPFCSESWELLVYVCPRCSVRQNWQHTIGPLYCHSCLLDLRRCETSAVPEMFRPDLSAAIDLANPDPDRKAASLALLPPELADAGASAAYELLVRLMPVVDTRLLGSRAKLTTDVKADVLMSAMVGAWQMMKGWPDSFELFAGSKLAGRTSRGGDGNGERTRAFLRLPLAHQPARPPSPLIVAAHERFAIDGPHRDLIASTTVDFRTAARMLGIKTKTIISLRRLNVFKVRVAMGSKRVHALFDRAEIESLAHACKGRISVPSAARFMGISTNGVEQLAAMGILTTIDHPYIADRYSERQLHRDSLEVLEQRISSTADPAGSAHHIPLHLAMKALGGRLKPWGPVVEALSNGRIRYSMNTDESRPLLHRVGVEASDVSELRKFGFDNADYGFRFSDVMSRADAEEVLHLAPKASTALFSSPGEVVHLVDGAIPVSRVEEIAVLYVTAVELSRRTGTSTRAVHGILSSRLTSSLAGFCRIEAELLMKEALTDATSAAAT